MRVTDTVIREIKQNITPAQAIEYYTGTSGRRGMYICPFHRDTHPSLSVKGNRWTCWACGASGDVIDFTQRYFSIGFRDAIAKLGSDFGVQIIDQATLSAADQDRIMWDQLARESERENSRQIRKYLDNEIEELTTAHRVLAKHNAPAELLNKYSLELDELIQERSYLK